MNKKDQFKCKENEESQEGLQKLVKQSKPTNQLVDRAVQSDFSDMQSGCPNCRQNNNQLKIAYETNFKLIKTKMFGTSELIQKYHQNQQDLADANNKLKRQNERLERACKESGMLRIQLDKALKALNPLKKTIKRNESEKSLLQYDLQSKDTQLKQSKAYTDELRDSVASTKMSEIDKRNEKQIISKEFELEKKRTLTQAKTIEKMDNKLQQVRDMLKEERKTSKRTAKEFVKLQKELEEQKAMGLFPDSATKNIRRLQRGGRSRGRGRGQGRGGRRGGGVSFRDMINTDNNNGENSNDGFDYKSLFTDDEVKNIYDDEEDSENDEMAGFEDAPFQRNVETTSNTKRKATNQKNNNNTNNSGLKKPGKPGILVKRRRSARLNTNHQIIPLSPQQETLDDPEDSFVDQIPSPTFNDERVPGFKSQSALDGLKASLRLSDSSSEDDGDDVGGSDFHNYKKSKLITKIFRQVSTIQPTISPLSATPEPPQEDNYFSDTGGNSPYLSDMDDENPLLFDESQIPDHLDIENDVNNVIKSLVDCVCSAVTDLEKFNLKISLVQNPVVKENNIVNEVKDLCEELSGTTSTPNRTHKNSHEKLSGNTSQMVLGSSGENESQKTFSLKTPVKIVTFEDKEMDDCSASLSSITSGKTYIPSSLSKIVKSFLVTDFDSYSICKTNKDALEKPENIKISKDTPLNSTTEKMELQLNKETNTSISSSDTSSSKPVGETPSLDVGKVLQSSIEKSDIPTTPNNVTSVKPSSSLSKTTDMGVTEPQQLSSKSKWKQGSFKRISSNANSDDSSRVSMLSPSSTKSSPDVVENLESSSDKERNKLHHLNSSSVTFQTSTSSKTFLKDKHATESNLEKPSVVRALPGLSESPGRSMRILKSILVEDIRSSPTMMERFKDIANFQEPCNRPLSPIAATPPRNIKRRDKERALDSSTKRTVPIASERTELKDRTKSPSIGKSSLRRSPRKDLTLNEYSPSRKEVITLKTVRSSLEEGSSSKRERKTAHDNADETQPQSASNRTNLPASDSDKSKITTDTPSTTDMTSPVTSTTHGNIVISSTITVALEKHAIQSNNTPLIDEIVTSLSSSITSSTIDIPPPTNASSTDSQPSKLPTPLLQPLSSVPTFASPVSIETTKSGDMYSRGNSTEHSSVLSKSSSPPLPAFSSISTETSSFTVTSALHSRTTSTVAHPTPATPLIASPRSSATQYPSYVPRYCPSTQVTYSSTTSHTSHIPKHRQALTSSLAARSASSIKKHVTFNNAAKIRDIRRKTASPTMAISPPISPIPPSPRRTILTPLISPLPVTPLPESISPLPPSPKIMSPPLIRGSAIQHSENSFVRVPVPIARKRSLSTQSITFDSESPSSSKNTKKCRIQNDRTATGSSPNPPSAFTKQRPSTSRKDTPLTVTKKPSNVAVTESQPLLPISRDNDRHTPLCVIVSESSNNVSCSATKKSKEMLSSAVNNLKSSQTSDKESSVTSVSPIITTNTSAATVTFKRCVKRTPTASVGKPSSPDQQTPRAKKSKAAKKTKQIEQCEVLSPKAKKLEAFKVVKVTEQSQDVSLKADKPEAFKVVKPSEQSRISALKAKKPEAFKVVKVTEQSQDVSLKADKPEAFKVVKPSEQSRISALKAKKPGAFKVVKLIEQSQALSPKANKPESFNVVKPTEQSQTLSPGLARTVNVRELKDVDRQLGVSEKKYVHQVIDMLCKEQTNVRSIILAFQKRTNLSSPKGFAAVIVECSMERGKKILNRNLTTNPSYKVDGTSCVYNGIIRYLGTPLLSRNEQQLLSIINGLKNAFVFRNGPHDLLEVLHGTLHKDSRLLPRHQETLCRFYASICRIFDMLDKLVVFLHGICYDRLPHLHFTTAFLSCYIVWPSIVCQCDLMDYTKSLQDGRLTRVIMSPLSAIMQFVSWYDCKDNSHYDLRKLSNEFFNLGLGADRKSNHLLNTLLTELAHEVYSLMKNNNLSSLQGDSDSGYRLNEFAFSAMKALVLACKRLGWQHTYNTLICDLIWKDLKQTLSQPDGPSQCDAGFLLILIGQLIKIGITSGWMDYSDLVNRIASLLSDENVQEYEKVQYAAALALKETLYYHPQICIKPIQNWLVMIRRAKGALPKYILDRFEMFLQFDGT